MILYLAGAGGVTELDSFPKLESYAYKSDALKAMQTPAPFFLDSGAFTAWSTGKPIKIEDYADFVLLHQTRLDIASNLDDIAKNEQLSYDNLKILENKGCVVAPVFHTREDFKWLDRYLDEGYDYILLGGMVAEHKAWLLQWLDYVWLNHLTNKDGTPKVKVHGFGMTIMDYMERYPWYSIDSSSWTYGSRFGMGLILYPHNKYVWTYFGQDHSSRKQRTGQNFWTFEAHTQQAVTNFIQAHGLTIEEITEDIHKLNLLNAKVFLEFAANSHTDHFISKEQGLFDAF